MRTLAKLCVLSAPALLLTALLLELVVFRFFVAVGDAPLETYDEPTAILHYEPGQRGRTFPDGDVRHPVDFAVNADGWNSPHTRYEPARTQKPRIAVIGDSYVAAFEVAPGESLAARLEASLGADRAEVYAFGMRGAPLSQYLHVARFVAATYAPDVIVVVLVHNDFDESYRPPPGRYTSAFLHFDVRDGKVVGETSPHAYTESATSRWLRTHSALLRFALYRSQVARQLVQDAYRTLFGERAHYQANVNVDALAAEDGNMRAAADYGIEQLAELGRKSKLDVILVMDAPRDPIYQGEDPRKAGAYRLNRIAADAAAEAGVRFVDLTDPFESDFQVRHLRFEFPTDGHWNATGQAVAAAAVCEDLAALRRTGLPECRR